MSAGIAKQTITPAEVPKRIWTPEIDLTTVPVKNYIETIGPKEILTQIPIEIIYQYVTSYRGSFGGRPEVNKICENCGGTFSARNIRLHKPFENRVIKTRNMSKFITYVLEGAKHPYAIVGHMAAMAHIYNKDPKYAWIWDAKNANIDILVTQEGLHHIDNYISSITPNEKFRYHYVPNETGATVRILKKPNINFEINLIVSKGTFSAPGIVTETINFFGPIVVGNVRSIVRMLLISKGKEQSTSPKDSKRMYDRYRDWGLVNDMDEVGLITPEIEGTLPLPMLERLNTIRRMTKLPTGQMPITG